jgi:hypothetical protein
MFENLFVVKLPFKIIKMAFFAVQLPPRVGRCKVYLLFIGEGRIIYKICDCNYPINS